MNAKLSVKNAVIANTTANRFQCLSFPPFSPSGASTPLVVIRRGATAVLPARGLPRDELDLDLSRGGAVLLGAGVGGGRVGFRRGVLLGGKFLNEQGRCPYRAVTPC